MLTSFLVILECRNKCSRRDGSEKRVDTGVQQPQSLIRVRRVETVKMLQPRCHHVFNLQSR